MKTVDVSKCAQLHEVSIINGSIFAIRMNENSLDMKFYGYFRIFLKTTLNSRNWLPWQPKQISDIFLNL